MYFYHKEEFMKKFQKMCALLAALALGLICFAGCSNDTGGSSGGGGNVSNNGGGNSNNEDEETPAITVVAKYVEEHNKSFYYIFYSDSSFKYIQRGNTLIEGEYYGTPTRTTTITLAAKKIWSDNAQKLLPENVNTDVRINKDANGDLYFLDYDFSGGCYYLD